MTVATIALIGAVTALIGGTVTAIVALRKLKPETTQILVSATEDVVVIQASYIKDQEARRVNQEARMKAQEDRMAEMERRQTAQLEAAEAARHIAELALAECNRERRELSALYEQERERNWALATRVEALEAEVAKLRARS